MAKPYREPPPWNTGAFYDRAVQKILLERQNSELGWPIIAFNGTEDLATAATTDWDHGDGFLQCYVQDPEWMARLLGAVTSFIRIPREKWTQERWIAEEWCVSRTTTEEWADSEIRDDRGGFKWDTEKWNQERRVPASAFAKILSSSEGEVGFSTSPPPLWKEFHTYLNETIGWPWPGLSVDGLKAKASKLSSERRDIVTTWRLHLSASY